MICVWFKEISSLTSRVSRFAYLGFINSYNSSKVEDVFALIQKELQKRLIKDGGDLSVLSKNWGQGSDNKLFKTTDNLFGLQTT